VNDLTAAWVKLRNLFISKILHADDTPHRIALGVGIGVFVAFTPTVGIQMVIAVALAAIFRANKAVCVPMVWITNPATIPVIYTLSYQLGSSLLGSDASQVGSTLATEPVVGPIAQLRDAGLGLLLHSEFWSAVATNLARAAAEVWVGSLLIGFIFGASSYFASRWAVTAYRERRRAFFKARAERRANRRANRRFTKTVRVRRPMA
jgi:uncharacterized protein